MNLKNFLFISTVWTSVDKRNLLFFIDDINYFPGFVEENRTRNGRYLLVKDSAVTTDFFQDIWKKSIISTGQRLLLRAEAVAQNSRFRSSSSDSGNPDIINVSSHCLISVFLKRISNFSRSDCRVCMCSLIATLSLAISETLIFSAEVWSAI